MERRRNGPSAKKEINPFHFNQPLAPLVAARVNGRSVSLPEVLASVRALAERCEMLLVEGAGGLFVPLGEGYTVADLIRGSECPVIVVARNRVGHGQSHAADKLGSCGRSGIRTYGLSSWMRLAADPSSRANARLIEELARPEVVCLPRLSPEPRDGRGI